MSEINGFILLDKDMGVSSHKALIPIKKLLKKKTKIGHTGTLDPNARGLLPVAIGRATKFIQYLGDEKKIYRAGIKFGGKTDTADIWGNIIAEKDGKISLDEFRQACEKYTGEITQVPPMYSAIKKDGKALYKYAREGVEVERRERRASIYSIEVLEFSYPLAVIQVECSKGTYIRTLIEDIAESISSLACMSSLIRLKTDGFDIEDAHKIDEFNDLKDIEDSLVDISKVFENLPRLYVDKKHEKHIKNGVPVDLNRFEKNEGKLGYYAVFSEDDKLFALANKEQDKFKTLIVI